MSFTVWVILDILAAFSIGWHCRGVSERHQRRDRNAKKTWEHRRQRRRDTQLNVSRRFYNLLVRTLLPADQFVVRFYEPAGKHSSEVEAFTKNHSSCLLRIKVRETLERDMLDICGHLGSEHFSYHITSDNIRRLESEIKLYLDHL